MRKKKTIYFRFERYCIDRYLFVLYFILNATVCSHAACLSSSDGKKERVIVQFYFTHDKALKIE